MDKSRKPAGRRPRIEKPGSRKERPFPDRNKLEYRSNPEERKKREQESGVKPARPYKSRDDNFKNESFSDERKKKEFRGKPKILKKGASEGTDKPSRSYKSRDDDFKRESSSGERPTRPYKKRDDDFKREPSSGERSSRPYKKRDDDFKREPSTGERPSRPYKTKDDHFKREPYSGDRERPEYKDKPVIRKREDQEEENPFRSFKSDGERPSRPVKPEGEKPSRPFKPAKDDSASRQEREEFGRTKPFREGGKPDRPEKSEFRREKPDKQREHYSERPKERRSSTWSEGRPERRKTPLKKQGSEPGLIRLNKYIADAGICSRREADKLISAGEVTVNGLVVTELGTKVSQSDTVQYADAKLSREKLKYVLLNKPKGFITTTDDPKERKTVMSLVAKACKERIYPVGRLDRNTTGLLLFTNDGELAKKLMHPKHGVRKVYHAVLDKALTKKDLMLIRAGIELDDGIIEVDAIEYSGDSKDKKQVGIELHSGKNRIVRRIFEQLDYEVIRLDRVAFAGMTKKNLPRSEWRFLDEKEISFLKMLS